jgi:hypothetical protein
VRSKKIAQFFISGVLVFNGLSICNGQQINLLNDIRPPQQASEYIFRSTAQESLISVQLLGAVNKPGVYYVPSNTDLLKLLTLAGGSLNNGDVSELLIRKQAPHSWSGIKSAAVNEHQGAFEVNAEKLIKFGGADELKLAQDDFVYVPQKSTWLSTETSRNFTVISVIMGTLLSAVLIQKYSEKK